MKKKSIALGLVVVGSALALGACGQAAQPASSNAASSETSAVSSTASSSSTGVVATKISVKTLPTTILKGDVIDLEKYVTVLPAEATWTLEAKTTNVTISGHKVTATNYGDFSVTVIAGSNSKKMAVKGNIISQGVKDIRDFIMTGDYNYTTTLQKADGTTVMKVIHNENYFVYYTQEDDPTIAAEGLLLLKADNKIYRFTIGTDGTVSILPGVLNGVADWHNYYGAFLMPLISTQIVDEIKEGTPTDRIVINPTSFDDYNQNNLTNIAYVFSLMDTFDGSENGTDDITNVNNVYNMTQLSLSLSADKTKLSLASYDKDGKATGYIYTLSDIGAVSANADVATAASTGTIPPDAVLTDLKTKVAAIKTAKTYTIEGKSSWLKPDGSDTLSDTSKDALEAHQSTYDIKAEVSDTIYHTYNLKKPDKTDPTKYAETVLQLHDGKYYEVVGDTTANTDGTLNVLDTYTASPYTALASDSDLSKSTTFSFAGVTDALIDAGRYSQRYEVKATDTDAAHVQLKIDNTVDNGALAYAINALFPMSNPIIEINTTNGTLQDDWYTYNFLYINIYDDKVKISSYENIDFGDTLGKARLSVDLTISAIGTTTAAAIDESKVTFKA